MNELNIIESKIIHDARCIPFPEYFPCEDESVYSIEGEYHHSWRKMMVYCNVDITGLNILDMYQVIPFETLFGTDIAERCVTYNIILIADEPKSIDTLAEQTLFCFIVGSLVKLNAYTEFHKVKFEMSGAALAACLKKE